MIVNKETNSINRKTDLMDFLENRFDKKNKPQPAIIINIEMIGIQ
jgi:hypothetical protein